MQLYPQHQSLYSLIVGLVFGICLWVPHFSYYAVLLSSTKYRSLLGTVACRTYKKKKNMVGTMTVCMYVCIIVFSLSQPANQPASHRPTLSSLSSPCLSLQMAPCVGWFETATTPAGYKCWIEKATAASVRHVIRGELVSSASSKIYRWPQCAP